MDAPSSADRLSAAMAAAHREDHKLRKELGFWSLVATGVFSIVLYLGLQLGYLGALPGSELAKAAGWHGVNLDSPFADIATMLGFTWLSWLLIADSSISPSGSGIVYTAANARNVFGLAKNGFFPALVMRVSNRTGVPDIAMLLNFVVGVLFLVAPRSATTVGARTFHSRGTR